MSVPHLREGLKMDPKIRASPCFSCGYPGVAVIRLNQVLAESIKNMFLVQKPAPSPSAT